MQDRFYEFNDYKNLQTNIEDISSKRKYEEIYDTHRIEYLNLYNTFIKRGDFSKSCVLDVGCGTGRYTKLLSKEGCNFVIGLDRSLSMLNKAKEKDKNSIYICGSVESLPFAEGIFNTIIMSQVIHWVKNKEKAFSEIYRVLSKKGIFLLNTFSHEQLSNLVLMKYFPDVFYIEKERFPDIEELTDTLKDSKFRIVSIEEIKERRCYTVNTLVKFAEDRATSALRIFWKNIGESRFYERINDYEKALSNDFPNNQIFEDHNYTLIICIKLI